MATNGKTHTISNLAELEALFPEEVYPPAKYKETRHITKAYRALIEASPFCVMATSGPGGLDARRAAIPRASSAWSMKKPLIIPDRRGNNRIDSLRNLVTDPRVALIFLIPGVSETVRVMGRATISADPELCASFTMQGKAPRCVLVIAVEQVFFQCAKALVRSKLWDPFAARRAVDAADRRQNPGRDHRRQARRRRARPPRARADEGDDLLRLALPLVLSAVSGRLGMRPGADRLGDARSMSSSTRRP